MRAPTAACAARTAARQRVGEHIEKDVRGGLKRHVP